MSLDRIGGPSGAPQQDEVRKADDRKQAAGFDALMKERGKVGAKKDERAEKAGGKDKKEKAEKKDGEEGEEGTVKRPGSRGGHDRVEERGGKGEGGKGGGHGE